MTAAWKPVTVSSRKVLEATNSTMRVAWYLSDDSGPEWLRCFQWESARGSSRMSFQPMPRTAEERGFRLSILNAVPEIVPAPPDSLPMPEIVGDHIEWSFLALHLELANSDFREWVKRANSRFPGFDSVLEREAWELEQAEEKRLATISRRQAELDALPLGD